MALHALEAVRTARRPTVASSEGPAPQGSRAFFLRAPSGAPPSRSAFHGGASQTGNPKFPAGGWVFPFTSEENPMIVVPANRDPRPIGVLLGGSGRARMPTLRMQLVPALFKPSPSVLGRSGMACVPSIAQG